MKLYIEVFNHPPSSFILAIPDGLPKRKIEATIKDRLEDILEAITWTAYEGDTTNVIAEGGTW